MYDAQNLNKSIVLSLYMSSDLKDVIDLVIRRNGFFWHHENILILMLAHNRTQKRQLAPRRILKAPEVKWSNTIPTNATDNIRIFNIPVFDHRATDYVDLIKW